MFYCLLLFTVSEMLQPCQSVSDFCSLLNKHAGLSVDEYNLYFKTVHERGMKAWYIFEQSKETISDLSCWGFVCCDQICS